MIKVTDTIALADDEIEEHFIRASGPGGQNVNKVASAVQLRFDAMASPALSEAVRQRLKILAGSRITQDGVIVITAGRFRSQERNREDAHNRLIALIREAAKSPRRRRPTKPTRASRERRLDAKKHQAKIKSLRRGLD
ncbi:MAG: alternative ribosome rescue aminoacyl-tRNA hydrolase ArfB [Sphingomonadales bacterium]